MGESKPMNYNYYIIMPDLQQATGLLIHNHLSVYDNGDAGYGSFNWENDD